MSKSSLIKQVFYKKVKLRSFVFVNGLQINLFFYILPELIYNSQLKSEYQIMRNAILS